MKNNNKLLTLIFLTPLLLSNLVSANDEWVFFPAFTEDTWNADLAVSATAGYMDIASDVGSGGPTLGLQLAFNCPVFTVPGDDVVLQQIDLNFYSNNDLKLTTLEINPRYFWNVSDGMRVGIGPGLGYMWTDIKEGKDPNLWSAQLGFDIEYRRDSLYASFGSRYQWTQRKTIGYEKNENIDNLLTTVKIGYNF